MKDAKIIFIIMLLGAAFFFLLGFYFLLNQIFKFEPSFSDWRLPFGFMGFGLFMSIIPIIGFLLIMKGIPLGKSAILSIGLKEAIYLLKHQKKCPKCNETLMRDINKIDKGIGPIELGSTMSYGKNYETVIVYKCSNCKNIYSLKELSETIFKKKPID